jgi:hypothetical protein
LPTAASIAALASDLARLGSLLCPLADLARR